MIQPALVRRLSGLTLLLGAGLAAVALVAGSPRVAVGVISGAVLGLLPIVTWSYLGTFFLPSHHPAEAPPELIGRDKNSAKADHPAEAPPELIGRDKNSAKADHPAEAPQKPTNSNSAKADQPAKATPLLFGAISLGKLLIYAAALAILIGRNLVDPLAFAGALLAPGLMLAVAARSRTTARLRDDASARQA